MDWSLRALGAALLTVTVGCAAIQATPHRLRAVVDDPVRRTHLAGRMMESCAGGAAVGALALPWGPLIGCPLVMLTEFLVYEYACEPLGRCGPYWERGPRLPVISADGSVAEAGDIYKESTEAFCAFHKKTWRPDPSWPSGGWCENIP